ncbi:MAG TPA: hypothetical protein VF779_17925, partial [Pyrinomonadaceae bacterium]
RLARRALVAALTTLILCAAVSAQTLRPETDPRNLSPAVGTGGPEGGPTGLFTIYDGQTIRRGEYTFSIAYSNYDRDPGNVDITDVPLSFNVGLGDHLELFFKTNGYRGIKVNSPQNLSSFYLPNSQLKFPFLGSGPAIVLAPNATGVNIAGLAVFRPAFNQPFVQFPFSGGSAGGFGQGAGNGPNGNFGCPGCTFTLGAPVVQPNSGNFGPADNFPGIGSPVGGILPGIVLATTTLPPTLLTLATTVPATYTVAPTYLPDAPFVNRLYGQSSFTNFVVGAKWRLTSTKNPLGVALIPFYRWYPDKADDFSGFNQMQRGSGPGGDIGDFGLVLAVDGRLSRSVNVSANLGYILNSNPKGTFGGTKAVLLDRPDEFIAGVGFDFPINKYFQPILELRSTQYVGGRTPNAFENSPVEALAGVKIYPHRWLGFGLAYRMHINQQDKSAFNGTDFNTTVNQITNVNPIGPQPLTVIPATTVASTTGSFPRGFIPSDDANGFIAQFWIGHRNAPEPPESYDFQVSLPEISAIWLPAVPGKCEVADSDCTPSTKASLSADIVNFTIQKGNRAPYAYQLTPQEKALDFTWEWSVKRAGKDNAREEVSLTPQSGNSTVALDFSNALPDTEYTITVEATYLCGNGSCVRTASQKVTPKRCRVKKLTPEVEVSCAPPTPDADPEQEYQVKFTATVSGIDLGLIQRYEWTVSAGKIQEDKPTDKITVTDYCPAYEVTATVTVYVEGCDPVTKSYTCKVKCPTYACKKFDEYNDLKFDDEKARLDNFASALQDDPSATGYYFIWGTCEGEGQRRADRAMDYLYKRRKINTEQRVKVKVMPDCYQHLRVELYVCPLGLPEPISAYNETSMPCSECPNKVTVTRHPKAGRKPHRRMRRRGKR